MLRLGVALFFVQSAYNLYGASLPLYFETLGFDPTRIGLLIGAAGAAELVGALAIGPCIDRFGGRVVLLCGAGCYLAASLGFTQWTAPLAMAGLRLVQGFGLAACVPSVYSFVPHLVRGARQTVAFASLGAAGNVSMAICPPLGLVLLGQLSPNALFLTAAAAGAIGLVIVGGVSGPRPSGRRLGFAFRRVWLMPLTVGVLSVIQWGVIQAFVPIVASDAGSNPGLLFTADAICVLASRIPAGWIADRYGPTRLALLGVVSMSLSPCVLLLPTTDAVLVVAGVLNGSGAGLTLPPMLAQLSQRSDESTRGTGLAFFSAAFAIGVIVGASGGGLLYPVVGFHGLLVLGATLCMGGLAALLADATLMHPRRLAPVETSRTYADPG